MCCKQDIVDADEVVDEDEEERRRGDGRVGAGPSGCSRPAVAGQLPGFNVPPPLRCDRYGCCRGSGPFRRLTTVDGEVAAGLLEARLLR